jgi:transposase
VDLRKEFILKALAQDVPFSEVCAQFSISRKTGYKWLERFHERGFDGPHDMSRRPKRSDRTSSETALEIIRLRQKHPTWGPKELQKLLSKRLPLETELPSVRTIGRVLERVQLVKKRRRRRPTDRGWMLQAAHKRVVVEASNDTWTVDFSASRRPWHSPRSAGASTGGCNAASRDGESRERGPQSFAVFRRRGVIRRAV